MLCRLRLRALLQTLDGHGHASAGSRVDYESRRRIWSFLHDEGAPRELFVVTYRHEWKAQISLVGVFRDKGEGIEKACAFWQERFPQSSLREYSRPWRTYNEKPHWRDSDTVVFYLEGAPSESDDSDEQYAGQYVVISEWRSAARGQARVVLVEPSSHGDGIDVWPLGICNVVTEAEADAAVREAFFEYLRFAVAHEGDDVEQKKVATGVLFDEEPAASGSRSPLFGTRGLLPKFLAIVSGLKTQGKVGSTSGQSLLMARPDA